jgi:LCP family protein required for cell wall assembly
MRQAHRRKNSKSSVLITVLLLAVIGAGFLGIRLYEQREEARQAALHTDEPYQSDRIEINYDGVDYRLRDDLDTYLFLGIDKFTEDLPQESYYRNFQQCDFLFLMIVDHSNQSYSALHINRDTMAEIRQLGLNGQTVGTETAQLALSHTYGSGGKDSCRNTVWSVSRLLYDVPIDHYVSITMDGVAVLNDTVGGVVVHISDDFSSIDPAMEMGKDVRLAGNQALTFVRSRMAVGDGSNVSRMRRQREYINALYRQIDERMRADQRFGYRLASALSDYVISDLTTDEMSKAAENLRDYRFTTIYSIEGEVSYDNTFVEFYPDEAALARQVIQLFFEKMS